MDSLTGEPGGPGLPGNPRCPLMPLAPRSPVSPLSPRGPWGPFTNTFQIKVIHTHTCWKNKIEFIPIKSIFWHSIR